MLRRRQPAPRRFEALAGRDLFTPEIAVPERLAVPPPQPVTIDPATAHAKLRATLANPKGLIVNGLFLRVRLTVQAGK